MAKPIDTAYYEMRIARERALAERSTDPAARRVHAELATLYMQILEPVAIAA